MDRAATAGTPTSGGDRRHRPKASRTARPVRVGNPAAVSVAAALAIGLAAAPAFAQERAPRQAEPPAGAVAPVFLEGDLVRGNTQAGITGPVCVMVNDFRRGEKIVFRIRARDVTGAALDDKGLKGIAVQLSDGQTFTAEYRARPPLAVRKTFGLSGPTDHFWSAVWTIPADYPTGSLGYKVIATDLEGRAHTWTPFNDPRSLPAVVPGEVQYTR